MCIRDRPAPAIDTTSQLRHRCSGFVWARHALIEPPAEGHKAVERKRFAPLPFARGSCPPFPRKPRQLRRAAGVSVVCEAKSVRSDRDLEPQTHRAQCAPPPTCERGNAFPAKPRAILIRMDIKTRNIATVSYTHLDVYKRQVQPPVSCISARTAS